MYFSILMIKIKFGGKYYNFVYSFLTCPCITKIGIFNLLILVHVHLNNSIVLSLENDVFTVLLPRRGRVIRHTIINVF